MVTPVILKTVCGYLCDGGTKYGHTCNSEDSVWLPVWWGPKIGCTCNSEDSVPMWWGTKKWPHL